MLVMIAALVLTGCKKKEEPITQENAGERFGQAFCQLQYETCACEDLFLGNEEQCAIIFGGGMQSEIDDAVAGGLTFHPECLEGLIDLYVDDIGCSTQSELAITGLSLSTIPCKPVSGSDQEGETCTNFYEVSGDSCTEDLLCFGTCQPGFTGLQVAQLGQTCDPMTTACAQGSFCDLETGGGTCVTYPGAGETCAQGFWCASGLRCDETGTCAAPGGPGATCDNLTGCASGAFCDSGICASATALGEPCQDFDECGRGNQCGDPINDINDICVEERPVVCF